MAGIELAGMPADSGHGRGCLHWLERVVKR